MTLVTITADTQQLLYTSHHLSTLLGVLLLSLYSLKVLRHWLLIYIGRIHYYSLASLLSNLFSISAQIQRSLSELEHACDVGEMTRQHTHSPLLFLTLHLLGQARQGENVPLNSRVLPTVMIYLGYW